MGGGEVSGCPLGARRTLCEKMSPPAQQVVFEQTVEGLLRAIRPRMTPTCKSGLKAAGLDVDATLLPAYPFEVWMKCLLVAAVETWPEGVAGPGPVQARRGLHRGLPRDVPRAAPCSASFACSGPRRAIHRATRNFRSGNNYTDAKVTELSDTCLELWMNEVGPYPTFTQGLVEAALRAAGVTPKVEIKDHDGHACTYRCTWLLTK